MKHTKSKKIVIVILAVMIIAFMALKGSMIEVVEGLRMEKPVIYIYPKYEQSVQVKLEIDGKLDMTYPAYGDGWHIIATSDGKLIDQNSGRTYDYLFWEGRTKTRWDMNQGFVVKGADTIVFLEEKLELLGLNQSEMNDFITYWAPDMIENPYNLISFQGSTYTEIVKLEIDPEPDTLIRVFMTYKPLKYEIKIDEQELVPIQRKGYIVVEWGGAVIE